MSMAVGSSPYSGTYVRTVHSMFCALFFKIEFSVSGDFPSFVAK